MSKKQKPSAAAMPVQAAGEAFDVRPSETVSIVAGDRVLFLGKGAVKVTVERSGEKKCEHTTAPD